MDPMRILVVDDEPAVREALRRALQLEGYDVELAGDGVEALERLAVSGVDAVLLDVMMPRLDGLETCRRLRRDGNTLPVLMLTARDAVSDQVAGLDAGADDYVVKPFALEELLARLRALLRRLAPQGGDVLRFPATSPSTRHAPGGTRRRADRADAHRVLAARALPAQPTPGADALGHLRARLGLRLRLRLELARRLHRLPAAQDGGGRQAAADPDDPRRRLRLREE